MKQFNVLFLVSIFVLVFSHSWAEMPEIVGGKWFTSVNHGGENLHVFRETVARLYPLAGLKDPPRVSEPDFRNWLMGLTGPNAYGSASLNMVGATAVPTISYVSLFLKLAAGNIPKPNLWDVNSDVSKNEFLVLHELVHVSHGDGSDLFDGIVGRLGYTTPKRWAQELNANCQSMFWLIVSKPVSGLKADYWTWFFKSMGGYTRSLWEYSTVCYTAEYIRKEILIYFDH